MWPWNLPWKNIYLADCEALNFVSNIPFFTLTSTNIKVVFNCGLLLELIIPYYCMATIIRTLWLAAKWALLSCNDWALLARCPRHIQSVLNLIVNILVMVNWQLSKRVSADQCHMTVPQAQVYNSFRWCVFLELSTNKLLVLIVNWSQAQVHNEIRRYDK